MSRRRSPRGRQRTSSNDGSQRLLQMMLVGLGVLFLLVGLLIGTGIPLPELGSSGSGGGTGGSGSSGAPADQSTPTVTPTATPASDDTAQTTEAPETTATPEPTATPTVTATPTATPSQPSGALQITERKDSNGNGYYSAFSVVTPPLTNSETIRGSEEVVFEIRVNDAQWVTEELEIEPGKSRKFTLDAATLRREQIVRGQAAVRVSANIVLGNGQTRTVEEWATTVNYEPEQ